MGAEVIRAINDKNTNMVSVTSGKKQQHEETNEVEIVRSSEVNNGAQTAVGRSYSKKRAVEEVEGSHF